MKTILTFSLLALLGCGSFPSESEPLSPVQAAEATRIMSFLEAKFDLPPQFLQEIPVVLVTRDYAIKRTGNENILGFNHGSEYIAIVETPSPWIFCLVLTHEYMHSVLAITTGDSNGSHKNFPYYIEHEACEGR